MRIKQLPEDFRVRELLADDVVGARGEHRVYRVIKRKLTSLQAAEALAESVGVQPSDVSLCGLKDRQGLTTQYMSVPRGKSTAIESDNLRIETVGFASRELSSDLSTGNAFELVMRGLDKPELDTLRRNLVALRKSGLINYFDEQRFGNLRHNQGWIALALLRGEHELALKTLLTATSTYENPRSREFKRRLVEVWGDWAACREVAGSFGQHHSVFEHLKRHPDEFGGAFFHVASRLRLIHLYAYQSHLWNRAVADLVRSHTKVEQRAVIDSEEGPLVYPAGEVELPLARDATFRLPGPRFADVTDEKQRGFLADALAEDGLVPAKFVIDGVPGFQIKGEDRPLFVEPRHLRVRPAERDTLNFPLQLVKVRFELPRGAYATLVVRRLLCDRLGERPPRAPSERFDAERDHDRRDEHARAPRRFERDGGPRSHGGPRDDRGWRPGPQRDERGRAPATERGPRGGAGFRGGRPDGPPRFDRDRPPRAGDRDRRPPQDRPPRTYAPRSESPRNDPRRFDTPRGAPRRHDRRKKPGHE